MSRRFFFVLFVFALGLTACDNGIVKPLPAPPKVAILPTTTTFPDYSGVSIPAVAGTTTIPRVQITGGTSSINGRVSVGGAPTGGVVVHIDRFVGDASAGQDTTSAADGAFNFVGLQGGRYRLRAYRPPDATLPTPLTFFVNAGQASTQNPNLNVFNGGINIGANIAPNPPRLGDVANVVVQVTTQGVDGGGVARSIGQPNLLITLVSQGGRAITTTNPATTNGNGSAVWTIRCDSLANQNLTAILPDGSQTPLNVAGCQLPPPTTTTTLPPVAAAPVAR